jgi:hypothetical protein
MYLVGLRNYLLNNVKYEADTGSGGTGGAGEGSGDGSEGDGDGSKGESNEGDKGASGDSSKAKSKTFTQDDVNAIAAKENKKAIEKIMKQLGVSDFKTAKEGLDKFKEIQDAQKTDAQKAIDKAKDLETTNTDLSKKVGLLNSQLAAMKADVNPDSLEDVIVLANALVTDDVTIDDAITKVLKKYPHFKRTGSASNEGDVKPPKFTDGSHKQDVKPSEADQWASAFKFN